MAKEDSVSEKVQKVRSDIEGRSARAQGLADATLFEIEGRVIQNPLGAVAIAAGVGFLLSQIRADRAAVHLGGIPFLIGALTTYIVNRRN